MEDKILGDIVHLLQDVQWLYNFPVTQIFTRNVFSKMPEDWKEALTELPLEVLNGIPQFKSQEHWPSSLRTFLEACERLSLQQLVVHHHRQSMETLASQNVQLPQKFTHGMSMKKKHEVTSLLSLMKRLSEISGSVHVLDIGSGIGYMDTLLHCMLKLTVIGAESENKNVRSANNRQRELSGKCSGVRHMTWTLADDTMTIRKAREVLLELIQLNYMCTCQLKRQCITSGNISENLSVIIDNEYETSTSAEGGDHAETGEGGDHAEAGEGGDHTEAGEGGDHAEAGEGDPAVKAEGCDHAETAEGCDHAETAEGCDHAETAKGCDHAETAEGCDHAETAEGCDHAETAEGGDHTETAKGGDHAETVEGGDHAETAKGGDHTETAKGGDHAETAEGGDHAETAEGGDHAETAEGGDHAETAEGGDHAETAEGGDHAETAEGGDHAETAEGGDHAETAEGGDHAETVEGGDHAETAEGGNHADTAKGGDHAETAEGGDHAETAEGGEHADTAEGGDHAETAEGGDHADTAEGGDHAETAEGGDHADTAEGGDHADTAEGGDHADTAEGGDHAETAEGGDHAETAEGGDHAETANGGDRAETAEGDDRAEAVAPAVVSYPPKSAILFGLHACADLSPIMIKIFKDCPEASSLVLLSCCYHKMQLLKENKMQLPKKNKMQLPKKNKMQLPTKNKMQLPTKNKRQLLKGKKQQLLKEDNKELLKENTVKQSDDMNLPKNYNTEMSCSNEGDNCEDSDMRRDVKKQFENLGFEETESKFSDVNGNDLINFPMSTALKNTLLENDFHMSVFGLRLAAQGSGLRWIHQTEGDHENHMRNVVYRALLEAFCIREGFTLRKLRRRCVGKYKFIDFSDYIKNVTMNYEFIPSKDNAHIARSNESKRCSQDDILVLKSKENSHRAEMEENLSETDSVLYQSHEILKAPTMTQDYIKCALEQCYDDYHHLFSLIEPLTGLQLALQPVLEALVHVDRSVYLKECGFTNVWMEEVFDAEVSPRNIALVAIRSGQ